MQLYANNIQDKYGNGIAGASVLITLAAGGALPTLYSDNGITSTANPIIADEEGEVAFYAANGRYTLTATGTGIRTAIVRNFELADGLEIVDAVTALAGGATADAAATAADRAQTGEDRIAVNADKLAAVDAASAAEISAAAALDRSLDAALSEYNAGQSAGAAADLLDDFKGRWYGALDSNPLLDPLGNPVSIGDTYFDTLLGYHKTFNGTTWERPGFEAAAVSTIDAAVAAVEAARVTAQSDIAADVNAVEAAKNTAITVTIPAKIAELDPLIAASYVAQSGASANASAISAALAAGYAAALALNAEQVQSFSTATGVTWTLTGTVTSIRKVFIDGILYRLNNFSISGKTVNMLLPATTGLLVDIYYV